MISTENVYIFPLSSASDFTAGTAIAVVPPGPIGCTDFLALVVDDNLALEGNEAFNIMIGGTGSTAMVTILDDDGRFSRVVTLEIRSTAHRPHCCF